MKGNYLSMQLMNSQYLYHLSLPCVGTSKDLGVSKLILSVIHVDGAEQLLCSFFVVYKLSLWNSTGIENPVSGG